MLRDDVVSLIASQLGKRTDLDATIIAQMQLTQSVTLEQHHWLPWFLETTLQSLASTAGNEVMALPSDFLAEIEEQALWLYNTLNETAFAELTKGTYDELLRKYPGSGEPVAYAIGEEGFLLKPTPDDAYAFKYRYYAADASLSANIENKWLKHAPDLMIAEVAYVLADKHLQNTPLADRFQADAVKAWDRLFRLHVAKQEVNLTRRMGDK